MMVNKTKKTFRLHFDIVRQRITTPSQQNWVAKLLSYDFDVEYKTGASNRVADALSRRDDVSDFCALSIPVWLEWDALEQSVAEDNELKKIIDQLRNNSGNPSPYSLVNNRLLYNNRIVLPAKSPWIPTLLAEFHSTPMGGHSGAYRTYRRLSASLYWKGMMKQVQKFVADCLVCQKNKYDTMTPAGLLEPLPILTVLTVFG
ncbi:hypothetical protein V5N11_008723 [Cardamine amara subsp. amara]|uniref:Integrase zinc-binding domain-containing protein n=1 Tax=Cardamine amara subsp. amara TaxID=228776 RepID=A0ABD0ZY04_CARAN